MIFPENIITSADVPEGTKILLIEKNRNSQIPSKKELFSKILFILLSVQRNIQFLFVLKINNSQLFFQNKPSGVHMSGRFQELLVPHERIRSCGTSSQEERHP